MLHSSSSTCQRHRFTFFICIYCAMFKTMCRALIPRINCPIAQKEPFEAYLLVFHHICKYLSLKERCGLLSGIIMLHSSSSTCQRHRFTFFICIYCAMFKTMCRAVIPRINCPIAQKEPFEAYLLVFHHICKYLSLKERCGLLSGIIMLHSSSSTCQRHRFTFFICIYCAMLKTMCRAVIPRINCPIAQKEPFEAYLLVFHHICKYLSLKERCGLLSGIIMLHSSSSTCQRHRFTFFICIYCAMFKTMCRALIPRINCPIAQKEPFEAYLLVFHHICKYLSLKERCGLLSGIIILHSSSSTCQRHRFTFFICIYCAMFKTMCRAVIPRINCPIAQKEPFEAYLLVFHHICKYLSLKERCGLLSGIIMLHSSSSTCQRHRFTFFICIYCAMFKTMCNRALIPRINCPIAQKEPFEAYLLVFHHICKYLSLKERCGLLSGIIMLHSSFSTCSRHRFMFFIFIYCAMFKTMWSPELYHYVALELLYLLASSVYVFHLYLLRNV